jgi:hypothetical protein
MVLKQWEAAGKFIMRSFLARTPRQMLLVRVIKSRRTRWAEDMALVGGKK